MPDEENNEESEWNAELIMPFVSVSSKGGPHDDNSYVAGFEMGSLDGLLQYGRPAVHSQNIQTVNKEQADLIAMHHGYRAEFTVTMEDTWTWVTMWKIEALTQQSEEQSKD